MLYHLYTLYSLYCIFMYKDTYVHNKCLLQVFITYHNYVHSDRCRCSEGALYILYF